MTSTEIGKTPEVETSAEVKEAVIVPVTVTITSPQDVVKVVNSLEQLVKKDELTRGMTGVTSTGKLLVELHKEKPLAKALLDENFIAGNIAYSHDPQIRADFGATFQALYAYVLSKNVPDLSGLVASNGKKSKGDGTPSGNSFSERLKKEPSISVEKIIETMMEDAKGTSIPRSSWKYIGYDANTGRATMSVRTPTGMWEKVGGHQYPGSLTYNAKVKMGYLEG